MQECNCGVNGLKSEWGEFHVTDRAKVPALRQVFFCAILPCLVSSFRGSYFVNEKKDGFYVGEVPLKWFIFLHLSLVVNSLAGTASKLAGREKFLSFGFIFWYGVMLFITMAFAVAWQQILKHMSLTFAFTNKPITIIWGLIWGVVIFHETLTRNMIIGSAIILAGIIVGVSDSGASTPKKEKDSGDSGHEETVLDIAKDAGTDPAAKSEETVSAALKSEETVSAASKNAAMTSPAAMAGACGMMFPTLMASSGSMFQGLEKYIAVWIVSVLISSIAQVMLKVEANKTHESRVKEYVNPMVIFAYGIFFLSTFLTMYALKYVPLTYSPIIEPLSYIFVPVIGVLVLKEKISKRRLLGIMIMIVGIAVFSL